MSESQTSDHPRTWWKEAIKRRRVRRFSAALVGGPRHRDYLVDLGMPRDRIALGYNAVDNDASTPTGPRPPAGHRTAAAACPLRPYFLAVNRFVPEKNLLAVDPRVRALSPCRGRRPRLGPGSLRRRSRGGRGRGRDRRERRRVGDPSAGVPPGRRAVALVCVRVGVRASEPDGALGTGRQRGGGLWRCRCWSRTAPGASRRWSPRRPRTGMRFDPRDVDALSARLTWMASLPESERREMGRRAEEVVSQWGPERFARGTIEALERARLAGRARTHEKFNDVKFQKKDLTLETDPIEFGGPFMTSLSSPARGKAITVGARPSLVPEVPARAGSTSATASTRSATAGWCRASSG